MTVNSIFVFTLRIRNALLTRWWQLTGNILIKLQGVSYHKPPVLYGYPIISIHPNSEIIIGDNVVLCSDSRFTALGISKPIILRTQRPHARIYIGEDTGLSGTVICAAVSIEIGSQCLIGADVQIFDNDFHALAAENRRHNNQYDAIASAAVVIEDNVFLGAGSKILKGVRIGKNSVIGAGSIVTQDIPANSIAVGNPAKVIAELPLN